jgi:hypothetical protein
MMDKNAVFSILSQLKTLEVQVTGLRIQMQRLVEEEYGPLPTLADFYGVLEGKLNVSEEEIEAVLYREPPDIDGAVTTAPQQAAQ